MVVLKAERRLAKRPGGSLSRGGGRSKGGRRGNVSAGQAASDRYPDLWAVEHFIATGAVPEHARREVGPGRAVEGRGGARR